MKNFFLLLFLLVIVGAECFSTLAEEAVQHDQSVLDPENSLYKQYLDSADSTNDIQERIFFLEQARHYAQIESNPAGEFKALLKLAAAEQQNENIPRATACYEQAYNMIPEYESVILSNQQCELMLKWAQMLIRSDEYQRALDLLLQSEKLAAKDKHDHLLTEITRTIGNVYFYLGDYSKSMEFYYVSLRHANTTNNMYGKAAALNNIAGALSHTDRTDEAETTYIKALRLSQNGQFADLIGIISNNLATIYSDRKEYETALDYFTIALNNAQNKKDWLGVAIAYNNLASVKDQQKDFKTARKFYKKAMYHYRKINHKTGLIQTLINYASLMTNMQLMDSAMFYLDSAQRLNESHGSLREESHYYYILHEYYVEVDDYRKALEAFKKFEQTEDSLENQEATTRIAKLQAVYNNQQGQKTIEELQSEKTTLRQNMGIFLALAILVLVLFLYAFINQRRNNKKIAAKNNAFLRQSKDLAQKNQELVASQKKLEELNHDRNQLMSIISHDLRSPFNSLLGFSEMLLEEINNEENPDMESIAMMANNTYKASMQLFELIQNLLEWSNSERGKIEFKPAPVILHKAVHEITNLASYTANQKNVDIINKVDKSLMVYADYNMLSTILRNLIFNAIKFTPSKGFVVIEARNAGDEIEIRIQDSGVGMSEEEINIILNTEDTFTRKGTDNEKGVGLGLVLTKNFIKRHHGRLAIESEIGKGTTFIVSLPAENKQ